MRCVICGKEHFDVYINGVVIAPLCKEHGKGFLWNKAVITKKECYDCSLVGKCCNSKPIEVKREEGTT